MKTFFALGLLLVIANASSLAHAAAEDVAAVKTVVANGIGDTPQSAAQNAAENALTEVVGSFIDKETLLEKRVEIQDGVRKEAKQIDTKVREYSQGSIKSFAIVDTSEVSGLYKVTAKVEVRIEDFKAFIKKLAEGSTIIGPDVFAQVATEVDRTKNINNITNERILMPLISGEVTEFFVAEPITLNEYIRKEPSVKNLTNNFGESTSAAIVVLVDKKLNTSYLTNTRNTLESIAFAKKSVTFQTNEFVNRGFGYINCSWVARKVSGFDADRDAYIAIQKSDTILDVYLLKDVKHNAQYRARINLYSASRLNVSVKGKSGQIYETIIDPPSQYSRQKMSPDRKVMIINDWHNFTMVSGCPVIVPEGRFAVVLNLQPSLLSEAKSISVKVIAN